MKIEWLVIPRLSATTSHAFKEDSETSVCGRIRLLDNMVPEQGVDRKCRLCKEKLGHAD